MNVSLAVEWNRIFTLNTVLKVTKLKIHTDYSFRIYSNRNV
jgi:hypothetical protein